MPETGPDFFRPEVRDALRRWRELLVAFPLIALGAWWAATSFGILMWLGYVIVLIGFALAWTGVQRGRFRQGGGGPGIVQIDERRLAYFGPLTGGVMDLDDLMQVELDPDGLPSPHWILTGIGGQSLAIPIRAEGAEALFDVFASLPGIRTERMLDVLTRTPEARVTIWATPRPLLH